jgi:hypothetical protein
MFIEQPYIAALEGPYIVAFERPYIVVLERPYIVALGRLCIVAHAPVSILTHKDILQSTKWPLCLTSHPHSRRVDNEVADGSRWRSARPSRSSRLTLGREPPGTRIESDVGWAQYPVWAICRKKKSLAPTGRTARSTVAIPTELHRPQDTVCSFTNTDLT